MTDRTMSVLNIHTSEFVGLIRVHYFNISLIVIADDGYVYSAAGDMIRKWNPKLCSSSSIWERKIRLTNSLSDNYIISCACNRIQKLDLNLGILINEVTMNSPRNLSKLLIHSGFV
jgi:hypothetical protein